MVENATCIRTCNSVYANMCVSETLKLKRILIKKIRTILIIGTIGTNILVLRASNSFPQQMVHGVDANENDGCALSSGHSSHLQPLLVVDDALANYTFIWLPLLSKRVEVMHKGAYDTQKTICFFPQICLPANWSCHVCMPQSRYGSDFHLSAKTLIAIK